MSGKPKTPQVSKVTIEAKAFHDLQQAEAKYRSTFENAAEGIFQSTPGGRYLSVNPAMARIYGYETPEEMIAAVTDIAHQIYADPEMRGEFSRRLKKEGKVERFELRALRKDGSLIWTSTNARIVRDAKGKVLFYEGFVQDITERKRAEEEIKSLTKFPDENPNPIVRIGGDGNVLYANKAAGLLFPSFAGAVGSPAPAFWRDWVTQAFASQADQAIEVEHEGRVYAFDVIPIIEDGYVNIYARDITERKRAEEQIAYQAQLLAIVNDAVVASDAQYRITAWNAAAESMYGWKAEEVLGRFGLDITRTEFPGVDKAEMLRAIAERGSWRGEATQARKDGTRIPVEVSSMVLRDESGQITGYVSVNRDITERKRAEKTLRESEERFRLLYEKAPLGYQSLDAAGCFIDVNQTWLDTLGYSREEVIGRWFGDFLAPHEVEAFRQRFPKFKATGEIQVEVETVRKDGAHAIIAIVGRIAYDEHGGFKQTHCILTDITERKLAEEALREGHERMAHLSRRLVEAQEEERRRIARELHDEVGQSLTALTISLEGVSHLVKQDAPRSKIAEIQELTKNLIAEVNALSVELRPRVLDDLGLIPGLLSLFSRFSSQTGVEIDFKHTGIKRKRLAPEIEISAYRIIQEALTNVVRHAGVKTASVRLQVEADMLWIQVQDEGKGFNLRRAMKAEDSMGLLSITERAEQVGGRLEVQTAPREGTLITCRLPLGGRHVDKEGV